MYEELFNAFVSNIKFYRVPSFIEKQSGKMMEQVFYSVIFFVL